MLRRCQLLTLFIFLGGVSALRAADLSVANVGMAPNNTATVVVSGNITSKSTFGVTILLELIPRAGATGTLQFTTEPPIDIVQNGDPWPGGGLFSPFDTLDTGSVFWNGSVDDSGAAASLVTFSGPLSSFPIVSSADATGVWDVMLSIPSLGSSGWEGLATTLIAGTVTVTPSSDLVIENLFVAPGNGGTLNVFGSIGGDVTDAVDILIELTPRVGAVGTLEFTMAPPVDIIELGDPWPGIGQFDQFDTNLTLQADRNGATSSSGSPAAAVTFLGNLAGFPVVASAGASGVWDVSLTVPGFGTSGWVGQVTGLTDGTITVSAGACSVDAQCDDGIGCTDDTCVGNVCVFTTNDLNCADDILFCTGIEFCDAALDCQATGDPCLVGTFCNDTTDTCDECALDIHCDDAVVCTDDTCVSGACVFTTNDLNCADDGLFCTGVEFCDATLDCQATGNPCLAGEFCNDTTDTCDACQIDTDCDDLVGCTDDTCVAGACVFTVNNLNCPDDTLFCNGTEFCDATLDCQNTGDPCAVGSFCNETSDVCDECVVATDCDDLVGCTDDTCVAGTCVFTVNNLNCAADTLFCNGTEFCDALLDCQSTGDPCSVGTFCNDTTDFCDACAVDTDCNDAVGCTDDTCVAGTCVFIANNLNCADDTLFCNGSEFCDATLDCQSTGDPCAVGTFCNESTDVCDECVVNTDCDDLVGCTNDACVAGSCVFTSNNLNCPDDGFFCNGPEICHATLDCQSTGDPCAVGTFCNDTTDVCDECQTALDCDDGVGCTDNACVSGSCVFTTNNLNCPDDTLFCNGTEFCDATLDCQSTGDPCPVGKLCDETTDTCGDCLVDTDCDDGIGCTDDTCVAGGCSLTPNNLNCPDDTLFCNGTEFCSATLDCLSTGDPCVAGTFCNDTTNVCDQCQIDSHCDDMLFCTGTETCVSGTCVASGNPCAVGQFCNDVLDSCDECAVDTDCDDVIGCTDDTCVSGACVFTVNNVNCLDDGLFCTGTEFCSATLDCQSTGDPCAVGTFCNDITNVCDECVLDTDCNDSIACTDDTCVAGSCVFTTNNLNCADDGLFCTGPEICDATLDCISAGDPCLASEFCNDTVDACLECLINANCDDGVACTDGTCVGGFCVFATNDANCIQDAFFCNGPEICDLTLDCISSGDPCLVGEFCIESINACLECQVNGDCNDNVGCTDDTCVSGACVFTVNNLLCADNGLFCDGSEFCDVALDCQSTGDPCPVGQLCDEVNNTCGECVVDTDCDDLVACTVDACVANGCTFTPVNANCVNDGFFCTGMEICDPILDCISTGDPCPVGQFCNDITDVCDQCQVDMDCDDLMFCTGMETCVGGTCFASGDPCLVGEFCNETLDTCDECVVDTDCDDLVGCTDDTCVSGACVFTVNNLNCADDTLFCTGSEFCDATLDCQSTGDPCLVGTFCNDTTDVCDECALDIHCDDLIPCTDDTCVSGSCVFTTNNLNCVDDGLFCTGAEICDAALDCISTGNPCAVGEFCNDVTAACDTCQLDTECDDGVACTDDTCVAGNCVFTTNDLNCVDDGLFCTGLEICDLSLDCISTGNPCGNPAFCSESTDVCLECLVGADCDDGVSCTDQSCVSGICVFTPNDANCVQDGLFCNGPELCDAITDCFSNGDPCLVGEFCNETTDTCLECQIDSDCNDGLPCSDDLCVNGICVFPDNDLNCDDLVGCTDDTCVGGNCVFTTNNLNCVDDLLFCTGLEICDAALDCISTGDPCPVGTFCNDATDVCDECVIDTDCNDLVGCTDDTCVAGSCVFTVNNLNCADDLLFCNGIEFCDATLDCQSTGDPCPVGTFCNDTTDVCDECVVDTDCTDSVGCTDDTCVAGSCVFTVNNLNCPDDTLFCTGTEFCDAILDCQSTGDPCPVGTFCNDTTNVCDECAADTDCNDSVGCTDDTCVAGACVFTVNNLNCPDDTLFCTGTEFCSATLDCQSTGDPCPVGTFCNDTTDVCDECAVDTDCTDSIGCTDDTCVAGTCVFTVNNLNCPDDTLFCTGTEFCSATLDCQSTGDPCPVGTFCNDTTNVCDECAVDTDCTDSVGCTDDTCVAGSCVFTVNNLNCPDDTLFCTGTEFCSATLDCQSTGDPCPAGTFCNDTTDVCDECAVNTDCDDAVGCTDDTCVAGACVFTVNNLNCASDTLFCTGTEFCDATLDCQSTGDPCPVGQLCDEITDTCGDCLVNTDCDDTVACTDDTCVAGGCVFTPNNLNCVDDLLFCTGNEICDPILNCIATGDPCLAGTFCNETTDVCDECVIDSDCQDSLFCTGVETCVAGTCVASGNPCLAGQFCNDLTDVCDDCQVDIDCNDAIGCTDDTCVGGLCVITANDLNCPDDGLFCSGTEFCSVTLDCQATGDPCAAGLFCNDTTDFCDECVVALDCDDLVGCTDDSCVAGVCVNTINNANCVDDGLFCTGPEICDVTLDCISTGDPCLATQFCNDTIDTCLDCLVNANCDDGVACTDSTCVGGFCVFTPNDANCLQDGLFCNGPEICDLTLDCISSGDPCLASEFCFESADICLECLVNPDCNDGVACTDDTCVNGACVFTPNNTLCLDDGIFCDGTEFCDATLGCQSTGDPCPAGQLCDEINNTCGECVVDTDCNDAVACTVDTCVLNGCLFTPVNTNCTDDTLFCTGTEICDPILDCISTGDPCPAGQFCNDTADVCDQCQVDLDCDDLQFCTGTETCVSGSCVSSGDPCTLAQFCNELIDTCDECVVDTDCTDSVGCTDDTCAAGACVFTVNNLNCPDDGLFCNGTESCDALLDCQSSGDPCAAGTFCNDTTDTCDECAFNTDCNDLVACTDDTCVGGSCVFTTNNLNCVDDGLFCSGSEVCDATLNCISTGNPCLAGEFCNDVTDACEQCQFDTDCTDGVPCTDDTCVAGVCVSTTNNLNCVDDGLFCTGPEVCDAVLDCISAGNPCTNPAFCSESSNACLECLVGADCDDGIGCTVESCNSGNCVIRAEDLNCPDDNIFCNGLEFCDPLLDCQSTGDPCLASEFCSETTDVCLECQVDFDCDDGLPCSDNLCVNGACVFPDIDANCNDGVGCTDDTCQAGNCVFTTNDLNCTDDLLFCTGLEICDASLDCISTGDPCLVAEFCNETTNTCDECALDIHCDDTIGCTDDTCVAGACVFTVNNLNCPDDTLFCNGTEFCSPTLDCQSTGDPCPAGAFCNDTTDACDECVVNTDCNDLVECTDDTCVAGACVFTVNNLNCPDDTQFCNGTEFCDATLDCQSTGDPCPAGTFCADTTDTCDECALDIHCDDGIGCTDDTCVAGACVFTVNDLNCVSDGLFCNGAELCSATLDCLSAGDPCPAGTFCNDTTDTCDECRINGHCDDAVPCTDNLCVAGACVFVPNDTQCPGDGLFCNGLEICDSILNCVSPGDPCAVGQFCNDTTDTCDECVINSHCNDSVPCTVDTCVGGACVFTTNNANCVDDGLFCTGLEICDATLDCISTGNPCLANEFCNDTTNTCDECQINTDCNDSIGCTDDTCVSGACVFTTNNANCADDGLFCTGLEVCDAALDCISTGDPCLAAEFCNDTTNTCDECQTDVHCDDGNPCTDETCVLGTCQRSDNTVLCNDNDLCTINDVCALGSCAGVALDCSGLNDACNVGVCNPGNGACQPQPINNGGVCPDDGNECTSDVCTSGTCTHPNLSNGSACIDDGNECTSDSCQTGICAHSNLVNGTICIDDGIGCTTDFCQTGACTHTPSNARCNDSNECTDDACDPVAGDPVTGCVLTPDDTNNCSDNNACSTDVCQAGQCQSTVVPGCITCDFDSDCDDGNQCTTDDCFVGACRNISTPGLCSDGNACTEFDQCQSGVCQGQTIAGCTPCSIDVDCDDANSCTADVCNAGQCENNILSDGVTCTGDAITCTVDSCLGGVCQHTPDNAQCSDAQSCTDDVCDPSLGDALTGCLFVVDDTNNCADSDPCTVDRCTAGACVSTVDPGCIPCTVDSQCDDGNGCTFDECFFGSCRSTPSPGLCDDGNPCSQFDQCFSGTCVGEAIVGCSTCTLDTECDDLNPCTTDTCLSGVCNNAIVADQTSCPDDGAACTADVCISGACEHIPDHSLCQAGFTCVPVDGCTDVPCFAPIVSTAGPRYFAIDPQPQNSATPVRLFVTSAQWPCLGKYVGTPIPIDLDNNQPGGTIDGMLATLVDNPVDAAMFAPGDWGGKACNNLSPACTNDTDCPAGIPCLPIMRCNESLTDCANDIDCPVGETCGRAKVYITGMDITPSDYDAVNQVVSRAVIYSVSTHCQNGLQSPVGTTQMNVMGDTRGSGAPNASDILLIVKAFQGSYHLPVGEANGSTRVTVDLGGSDICNMTLPMTVNAADIVLVVKSFQLLTYADMATLAGCALPCP